ncbi:MAG: ECF transporter S component [Clostridia bacterium]|jgi:riboflavin transporter FmnP|nr:ECF transporter S component [Clostridia bacterium]
MAKKNYFNATRIAVIALFSTLSGLLYILNFPIAAAFPSFLELNFSDIPALIGTFALGPLSGAIIVVMKVLIKLVVKSTSTMFVGDLADIVIGIAFVVPAGLLYKHKRTFKGALIGMGVGTLCSVAFAVLFNRVALVPLYVQLYFGGKWEPLVGMMTPLFPSCTKETFYNFYLWVSVLPFNMMRCLIAAVVTLLVYKRISVAINRLSERLTPKGEGSDAREKRNTLIAVLVCAFVILLLILFTLLHYFLWRG